MTECSCWIPYPNKSHKRKNGHWKCVDDYKCVHNIEHNPRRKTKCVKRCNMLIVKEKEDLQTCVDELCSGEVFKFGQYYYIKTNECVANGDICCVNLESGFIVTFNKSLECVCVDVKLVVK